MGTDTILPVDTRTPYGILILDVVRSTEHAALKLVLLIPLDIHTQYSVLAVGGWLEHFSSTLHPHHGQSLLLLPLLV
jgi:hypothetical protein